MRVIILEGLKFVLFWALMHTLTSSLSSLWLSIILFLPSLFFEFITLPATGNGKTTALDALVFLILLYVMPHFLSIRTLGISKMALYVTILATIEFFSHIYLQHTTLAQQ